MTPSSLAPSSQPRAAHKADLKRDPRRHQAATLLVLRKALANYPVAQLGSWTWILVRSEDLEGHSALQDP
jgi:hypothetical protein